MKFDFLYCTPAQNTDEFTPYLYMRWGDIFLYERGTCTDRTKGDILEAKRGLQLFPYLITTKSNNEVSWHFSICIPVVIWPNGPCCYLHRVGSNFEFLPAFTYFFLFLGKQFARPVVDFWNLWSKKEGRSSGSGEEVHSKN